MSFGSKQIPKIKIKSLYIPEQQQQSNVFATFPF